MDENGTPYEVLTPADIQDLEPNLAPIFARGIYQRDSRWLTNPDQMVRGMVDLLISRGGCYRQFDVRSIHLDDDDVVLQGPESTLKASRLVIAAGPWSRPLAKQLGDSIPLDTERGYHLTLSADSAALLTRPVLNGTSSFQLSPMESGLRLTTQVEFAGLDAAPDYRRIRSLLPVLRRMLPDTKIAESSVWMGRRPSLPDSLPVLGFSSASKNVLYAFGHQHLGMTMGPMTGLVIADLVAGRDTGLNMSRYRPDRFWN